MSCASRLIFAVGAAVVAMFGTAYAQYSKPPELANPYRLVEGWPSLPASMNGGRWGEVIRVHVHSDGNIWIFHRCFNVVPPGSATCIGRGEANPPILQFDPSGKLLKSFGTGLFAYPHGFTVDAQGNLWVSDVNDEATVLGMSAKNAAGVILGQEVLKLSSDGKVLLTLGKEGVGGPGTDTFDRPTGVAVAPNGDIFVSDGHHPNRSNNARVLKFDKDGKFIKTWGHLGKAPGDFDEPHDFSSAARRTAFTSPIGETSASRCSTRTAISSPPGRSSASPVPCSSARTTRFMSARPFATRPSRMAKCGASSSATPEKARSLRSFPILPTSTRS
jgi:hypothetical protein